MPFVPSAVRITVMAELSPEAPRLKLRDTESVLTFHFPKHDPDGPNQRPDPKLELAPDGVESLLSLDVRTFDGLQQITDRYWDVKPLGAIDSNDVLILLKLRAGELMKDLGSSNSKCKNEARSFYEAIVMRKRVQLQFRLGEYVKPSVLVDFDHRLNAR